MADGGSPPVEDDGVNCFRSHQTRTSLPMNGLLSGGGAGAGNEGGVADGWSHHYLLNCLNYYHSKLLN